MNKREAKILALETIANSVDILIELDSVSDTIKSEKDSSLINEAFDEISNSLLERVEKLKRKVPLGELTNIDKHNNLLIIKCSNESIIY